MSAPLLPAPPEQYQSGYFAQLLRTLRTYFIQLEAVRHINIASCNINLDTLPTTATGARDGDVWADGSFLRVAGLAGGGGGSVAWGAITGTLSDQTDLNSALAGKAAASHTHAWSAITSTPTTIAGYGITDFNSLGDARWSLTGHNHSGVYAPVSHAHSGGDITSGTVAATYLPTFGAAAAGIVGASGGGTTNFLRADGTWAAPPAAGAPAWGTITGTLSDQTDLNTALNGKQAADADLTAIAALTGVSGFLKTNGAGTWSVDTATYSLSSHDHTGVYAPASHNQAWSTITSTPTTIGGYGITDFNSLGDARWSLTGHNHTGVYAPASHAHSGSDITSGTVAATYLPTFGTSAAGIVGASGGGSTNYLRADGTWAAPPGTGSNSPSDNIFAARNFL